MQAFCGGYPVFLFSYYIIFLPVFLVFQWVWGYGVKPIYNQIALGNDYQFDVKNSYTVVKESDAGETATVDVYYSPVLSTTSDSESAPKTNYGILSYNSDKSVYVAFEIDSSISNETITYIANSIEFID